MHNEENPRETKKLRVSDGMRGRGGAGEKKKERIRGGISFRRQVKATQYLVGLLPGPKAGE